MPKKKLLGNALVYFQDCCRTFFEHRQRQPRCQEVSVGNDDLERAHYHRVMERWEINHIAHEEALGVATRLIRDSEFSEGEKAEIGGFLPSLEKSYGSDETVTQYINEIREHQNLSKPAAQI